MTILIYTAAKSDIVNKTVAPLLAGVPWSIVDANKYSIPDPAPEDVVLSMGQDGLDELQAAGIAPKGRTITSMREKLLRRGATRGAILVTYAPGIKQSDAEKGGNVIWDIRLAKRLHMTGSLKPVIGKYWWLTAPELEKLVDDYIARSEKKPLGVAVDLETMGFYPWYADKHIVTGQLTADEGEAYAVHVLSMPDAEKKRVAKAFDRLLNAPNIRTRGANLKFDLQWMKQKWGITCTNFTFDTLLVGSLLDENRSNGLSWHTKEHTDLGGYDHEFERTHDKGHMEKIPVDDPEFLTYAAGDADACLRISNVQIAALSEERKLAAFYKNLLHPAARAFERIEERGVLVDLNKYGEVEQALKEEIAEAHSACIKMMPARLRAKHAGELSLTRPSLVGEFMFGDLGLGLKAKKMTAGGKNSPPRPATDKAHMQMFLDVPEAAAFLEAHARWSVATKMLGTYVHGFLEHLRPDKRFHPTYLLFNGTAFGGTDDDGGTTTGRLSAKNPAMQTVPKHPKKGHKFWAKMLRSAFPAPPGYLFFEVDFSQGELKITACVSGERTMLSAYQKGMDLHCLTGAGNAGMSYEDFKSAYDRMDDGDETLDPKIASLVKRLRQQAKAQNFGLLYGMGPEGFQIYARDVYGVSLTMAEAERAYDAFFETYPGLTGWHKRSKNFARKHGYIVSPLGRIRHLPLITSYDRTVASLAERQAVNSPIQSTLSDLCLLTIVLIEERWADTGDVLLAGMTHDSAYGYVREEKALELMREIRAMMANLPLAERFDWEPELEFTADAQLGADWGALKKAA